MRSASAINGLTIDGRMVVVGVPHEPFQVFAWQLLYGRSITGSAGGVGLDSQDAMRFAALNARSADDRDHSRLTRAARGL